MPDSLFNRPGRPQRIPVYVNVYDLVEDSSYLVSAGNLVGVGIYHSGIEVMDKGMSLQLRPTHANAL